jgi:predicted MFS family arabinose efflux permease
MTKPGSSSMQLWIFFFAQIVFFADFQNIILYFRTFSEVFNIDYLYMGFLVSIYSIFTLSSPIFGSLSDLYGRKGFLLLGLALFTLSSLIISVAQIWEHILIARALAGLASAIFLPILLAQLGDSFSYKERTRAMGLVRLAWPITFIIGPPLVGYCIEHINWRLPHLMMGIGAIIMLMAIHKFDFPKGEFEGQVRTKNSNLDLFTKVLLNRSAVAGLVMILLAVGAIQGIFVYFPTWMETEFQVGESVISTIYSFMGVGTLFGTILATWIGDKFGPKQCAVTGLAIASGCMLLLSHFSFNPIFVIFWLLLLGTSFDFSVTVQPVLLTQLAPNEKGTVMSLNGALKGGAIAISTALCGLLWAQYNYLVIGIFCASLALTGALIGIFAIKINEERD